MISKSDEKNSKRKFSFRDFARIFARTRNPKESALSVGIDSEEALLKGEQLLSRKDVKAEIRKIDKENPQNLCAVKAGLSRIAFGSVNEAVALVFEEQPSKEEILRADLFNLSEIKKVKGGGVEMKFADRQKALEKLVEFDPALKEVSDAQKFLNALCSEGKNSVEEENDV